MNISIKDVSFEFVDGLIIPTFEDGENNSAELDNILKVTICSLGKGELIEVVTKDYDYYSFPIKGGRLKALASDLQQVGIDASYIYRNGVAK